MERKYWRVPKERLQVSRLLDAMGYRLHEPYLVGGEGQDHTHVDCDMNPYRDVYTLGEIVRIEMSGREQITLWYDIDGKQEKGGWWRPTSSKIQQLSHALDLRDFLMMNEVPFEEKPSAKIVIRKLREESNTRQDLIKRLSRKK